MSRRKSGGRRRRRCSSAKAEGARLSPLPGRDQARDIARILCSAPGRPYSTLRTARMKGARDASGPGAFKFTQNAQTKMLRPTGLDASRHRGVSKSNIAASPPVPRRPARGVFRSIPQGPRWTYRFGRPASRQASLSTASGPDRRELNVTIRRRRHHGATWRGAPRRDLCGFNRRAAPPHLRRDVIPRPPLPAPHLQMLIRHPFIGAG